MPETTHGSLIRVLAEPDQLERDVGTTYYILLVYHHQRFDTVLITIVTDGPTVRNLHYHYHERLSGQTVSLRFENPGNGEHRNPNFAFSSLSNLLTTNRPVTSPSESDDYFLLFRSVIVYRLLVLVRLAGTLVSDFPVVYHCTAEFERLELFRQVLSRPIPAASRRAGLLELNWE